MQTKFKYGKETIEISLPDNSIVYKASYEKAKGSAIDMLDSSLNNPIGCDSLSELLKTRKEGKVVIVVSDITRPIPYYSFLPNLISYLKESGVAKNEILILVATGMHRPSTPDERIEMFGKEVVNSIQIVDHDAEDENGLEKIEGKSWSGLTVRLNTHYVQAGFRIITGLVEPHFMAGFSGGRKAICPGLASLDAVQKFHGFKFLSHPHASNTILEGNPCHQENTSIAKMCPAEYSINIVLDQNKKLNAIFSGELFVSHGKTVEYVKKACCPKVEKEADLVITSSGGYPLDITFYQCVKGMVSCLPTIKKGAEIISFGSCSEGIGSPEYTKTMLKYSNNYKQFIKDIQNPDVFVKDQWQFQMHAKTLDMVGIDGLHFFTSSFNESELGKLSVNPHVIATDKIQTEIQKHIDKAVSEGKTIAVLPEGPYCAPV